MAKGGIPVVLVENGTPAMLSRRGMPITIVGGSGGDAALVDGQVVPVKNSAGADEHDGNAVVSGGAVQAIELQNDTATFIDDGDVVNLTKADGTAFIAGTVTATASVSSGALANLRLPTNETVLKDQQSSINIGQFDGSAGPAAIVGVANNLPVLKLANATTRIVVSLTPITVVDAGGKTASAAIAIDQGLLQNFPLSNATDSIVSHGQALQVPVTGTYTNTATVNVAAGVVTGIVLS